MTILKRLVLDDLLQWKKSKYRKPLILKGVRQVGKTWILNEFGRQYYDNIAYFNFDEQEELVPLFETTKDVKRILQNLSTWFRSIQYFHGHSSGYAQN